MFTRVIMIPHLQDNDGILHWEVVRGQTFRLPYQLLAFGTQEAAHLEVPDAKEFPPLSETGMANIFWSLREVRYKASSNQHSLR